MKRLLVFCSLKISVFLLVSCIDNSRRILKYVDDKYHSDMPDNVSKIYNYSNTLIDSSIQ